MRIIAHHAGIAIGFYGTSHHATEDLGLMRSIAGLTVVCPCDATATEAALRQTADLPGPVYFRVGRGRDVDVYDERPGAWRFGEAAVLREGDDLTIVANGVTVSGALEAAAALAADGVEATVIDAHTVRPFDDATIAEHAGRSGRLLVAEEHNVVGGVATRVRRSAGRARPRRRADGADRDARRRVLADRSPHPPLPPLRHGRGRDREEGARAARLLVISNVRI